MLPTLLCQVPLRHQSQWHFLRKAFHDVPDYTPGPCLGAVTTNVRNYFFIQSLQGHGRSHDHESGVCLAAIPYPQRSAESRHTVGASLGHDERVHGCMSEFIENTPASENHTSIRTAFKETSEAIFIFDFLLLCNFLNEGVPLDASSAGTYTSMWPISSL